MCEIVFPATVTSIGYDERMDTLFEGIVFVAPKGSYAIEFAKEHGIDYREWDEDGE